jgi:hypothetical protein
MRTLVCFAAIGLLATRAGAQGRGDGPAGVRGGRILSAPPAGVSDSGRGPTFVPRALLGTLGTVGGVFAGAYLGVALLGTDCGGCDDPGLGQALVGATVGSVVGAAAVSAIPALGSPCRYGARFGRALIGSTIGALLGGIASGGSELILVTYPLGTGVGAAVGANSC